MIFDEHKISFIGIPRTGSTGIYNLLKDIKPNLDRINQYPDELLKRLRDEVCGNDELWDYYKHSHFSLLEFNDIIIKYPKYNDYLTFSFVRNPYTRMVSLFHRQCDETNYKNLSFGEYCKKVLHDSEWMNFWGKQYELLKDRNGEIGVDFVGRVENFDEDWNKLRELVPSLPPYDNKYKQTNKSNIRLPNIDDYYDDETRELVYDTYKNDFIKLNYDK